MMTAGLSRALGLVTVLFGIGILALFILFLYPFEIYGYFAFIQWNFAIYGVIWLCYLATALYSSSKPISPKIKSFLSVSSASISGMMLSLSANLALPNLLHLYPAVCGSQAALPYLAVTFLILIAAGTLITLRNRKLFLPAASFVISWCIAALPLLVVTAACHAATF